MKKLIYTILFSIFLISCATTKVEHSINENDFNNENNIANEINKTAHQLLRELFEKYAGLSALEAKGFSLEKLDSINDGATMKNYLESFFIDEEGYPFDNSISITYYDNLFDENGEHLIYETTGKWVHANRYILKTKSSRVIKFGDEYGTKEELLAKGYVENETMFRSPMYARWVQDASEKSGYRFDPGTWHENGYRVGKCYMTATLDKEMDNLIVEGKNYLYIGITDDTEPVSASEKIKKSKKDNLILDLTYSQLRKGSYIEPIVEAIKEMNPKKVLILISSFTSLYSEVLTAKVSESGLKVIKIGQPTKGWNSYFWSGNKKWDWFIQFNEFEIYLSPLADKEIEEKVTKEGLGICPDLYTIGDRETDGLVKYLIEDSNFNLPILNAIDEPPSDKRYDANMMIYLGQKSWGELE